MVKKIKTIKRIKKKSVSKKFTFDDDTRSYSALSILRNLTVLVVLIVAFFITQMGIIQPTNNKARMMKPDLIIRKIAIEKGEILQQSLSDKEKIANSAFNNVKISFFRTTEGEPFYKFLSNIAIKNRLTISSITKLGEGDYKEAKKDNPEEVVTYEDYQQVSYKLTFKGTFIDYINFIKDLQIADKSLSTDNALIKQQDDKTINVTSTLTVKLMKI